jgi:hypothetical protein
VLLQQLEPWLSNEDRHLTEALPTLETLREDTEHIHFDGLISVGDAAREAITILQSRR